MTRVIKFRAWDTKANQWVEESALSIGSNGMPMVFEGDRFRLRAQTVILQQFTGLTDVNGKEIYEGDVLQWTTGDGEVLTLGPVKWREEVAIWAIDIGIGLTCIEPEDLWVPETVYEVIGNIHENPELLEVN